jgi:hypothetical protein
MLDPTKMTNTLERKKSIETVWDNGQVTWISYRIESIGYEGLDTTEHSEYLDTLEAMEMKKAMPDLLTAQNKLTSANKFIKRLRTDQKLWALVEQELNKFLLEQNSSQNLSKI